MYNILFSTIYLFQHLLKLIIPTNVLIECTLILKQLPSITLKQKYQEADNIFSFTFNYSDFYAMTKQGNNNIIFSSLIFKCFVHKNCLKECFIKFTHFLNQLFISPFKQNYQETINTVYFKFSHSEFCTDIKQDDIKYCIYFLH